MDEGKRVRTEEKEARRHLQQILDAEATIKTEYYDRWETLRSAYEFGPNHDGSLEESRQADQPIGIISSTLQSLLPYLFLADPSIYGRPKRETETGGLTGPGNEKTRAKICGAALQHQWTEAGDYDEVEDMVLHSLIDGFAIGRTVYNSTGLMVPYINYDTTTDTDEIVADDQSDDDRQREQLLEDRLAEMGLFPDRKADTAAIQHVPAENFVWPQGHTKLRTCPWLAVRHLVHIDDVVNNPSFKNTKGITADRTLTSGKTGLIYTTSKGEADHVEIWEKWHYEWATRRVRVPGSSKSKMRRVKELRVLWVCNQAGAKNTSPIVLKHTVSHLDMEGYPFEMLRWWRVPKKMVGISLAQQMLPFAVWLQRLTNGAVAGLEAAMALKVMYHEGKLGKNGLQLLGVPRPTMVPVKDKRDVRNAVAPLVMPAFPQELHGLMNMIRGLMAEVGAGDEAMRGGRSSAKSATESAIRASSQQGKSERMLAIFEKTLTALLRKKWQIMQQYFTATRMARITGLDEGEYVEYSRADIQGEFDIGIHIGSTVPTGPEADRDGFIGFLQTLGTAAQVAMQAQVPPEGIAALYEKSLEIWNQDSPEIKDGFAAVLQQTAQSAGQAPPPAGTSPDGQAADPMTGESLNGAPAAFGGQAQSAGAAMLPPSL
jgi:hypothetical protein